MLEGLVAIFIGVGIVVVGVLLYMLLAPYIQRMRGGKEQPPQPLLTSGGGPAPGQPQPPSQPVQPRVGPVTPPPPPPPPATPPAAPQQPAVAVPRQPPQPPAQPASRGGETLVSPVAQAPGAPAGGKRCPYCGTINSPNAKYCKKCGRPLP